MSRRFDGSDDYINCGDNAAIQNLTAVSYSGWFYLDAFTTADGMRIAGKRDSVNVVNGVGNNAESIQFFAFWSGDDGNWNTPANSVSIGVWTHVAVTYAGSATTDDPLIYLDGVSQTITKISSPTGSQEGDSGNDFDIGNNATPGVRPFDGSIAEIAYYNRVITAQEVAILASRHSPLFVPNGLVLYLPLIGKTSPEINIMGTGNGTITGAVVDDHLGIVYPTPAQLTNLTPGSPPSTTLKDIIGGLGIIPFAR